MRNLLIIVVVSLLMVSVGRAEDLQTLTGVFHHGRKATDYLILDGSLRDKIDLIGQSLETIEEGSRVLVRGEIRTRYQGGVLVIKGRSPDWFIYMDVQEIKVIDKDADVSTMVTK
jgi:hypothetical protein